MSNTSVVMKLIKCAAHLYPDDFREDIKDRTEHPYKAVAPEHGIDLALVAKEINDGRELRIRRSFFIFLISIISFSIFILDTSNNAIALFIGLFFLSLVEFFNTRKNKKIIQSILNEDAKAPHNEEDKSNVVISGGYSPFIGSGVSLDSWSFTTTTSKPNIEGQPIEAVNVFDLYNEIEENIKSLNLEKTSIQVYVKDQIFVDGRDVGHLGYLLLSGAESKPVDKVKIEYVKGKINSNETKERYYKSIQLKMWSGQIILSSYIRFYNSGDTLFTEARFFLLPPLKNKYLKIANTSKNKKRGEAISDYALSIVTAAFSWIPVYIRLIDFIQGGFMSNNSKVKAWKKELTTNRNYNYGWETSLREKWSEIAYERYFQMVDKDYAQKILTNCLLSTLTNHLASRNVNIDQFEQTATKIINEGIIMTGGSMKTESLAVGKAASVVQSLSGKSKD